MSEVNELLESGQVVEVFGEFMYQVDGKRKVAATLEDAAIEIAKAAVGEAARTRANAYCAYLNITDKNAQGKVNIVSGFLAWEAAGSPEYVAPAVEEQDELEGVDAPEEAPSLDA